MLSRAVTRVGAVARPPSSALRVLGADRRALRGLGDDHFSRAQHALQVSRRDQAGPGDTGRPHGIIASTDTWLPTVDHQDPLLWIQKLDDASAGEQGSRSALEGGAQLSERAELTLARASFPPGTTAHALASAGDLRALRRHLHQRALPGAAAARGFSTSARAAQHITHISGSGEELLQLNLPTASPVRSQPLMAVRTSDDTVHDPSDFRPDNLKVLVNPYTDSPLPSISHIAETPLGKDGLGGDMMSEHMVDHSSGKALEHVEKAMQKLTNPETLAALAEKQEGDLSEKDEAQEAGHSTFNVSPGGRSSDRPTQPSALNNVNKQGGRSAESAPEVQAAS